MINRNYIQQLRSGECRIAQMKPSDRMKLVRTVPAMMKMLGCKFEDDSIELVLRTVENIMASDFGMKITAGELNYAFQLYISGDVTVPKEFQHYGQFNLKFITEMVNDYVEKRSSLLKYISQETIATEKQLASKDPFDECMENYIFMLEVLKENGKMPKMGNFDYCYMFLEVTGVLNPTLEEKKDHAENVRILISQEMDEKQSPELRREFRKLSMHPEAFKIRCKDEFFKTWVESKLTDFVDQNGNVSLSELSAWIDEEIENTKRKNMNGEFNQYRVRITTENN